MSSSGRREELEVEGKIVERVAMDDRRSIRRAWMADSWMLGIEARWADWSLVKRGVWVMDEAQRSALESVRRIEGRRMAGGAA